MVSFIIFFMIVVNVFGNNQQHHTKERQDCENNITNGTFKWKYDGHKYTASSPLCWQNDHESPVFRECNTSSGIWEPLQVACMTNVHPNTFCPEDLIEISGRGDKKLCLRISETPDVYDERICYGSDSTILNLSEDELYNTMKYLKNHKHIDTFWLPIHRKNKNYSKHFTVRLPGKKWEDLYNVNLTLNDIFSEKNCMSLRYKESETQSRRKVDVDFNVQLTSCQDKLHSVCVFQKRIVAASGCPQGFAALSYKPTDCFGINWESGRFPEDQRQLSVAEYYRKRNSLRLIFNELDSKPEWFEVHRFIDRSADQYAVLLDEKENVEIRYIGKEKNHAVCTEVVVNRKNVEMIVKFDGELDELVLVVYNRHYLWKIGNKEKDFGFKCFTNADYDEWSTVKISLIWENDEQTKSIFKLKRIGNGLGEYWCEAHTIFDFDLIKTNRVVASKKIRGHQFSMLFDMPCIDRIEDPSCIDLLKNYKSFAEQTREILTDCTKMAKRKNLVNDVVIHDVRVMRVDSFSGSSLRSFVHVMISDKHSAVDNSEEESSEENDSKESSHGVRHDTSVRMNLRNILSVIASRCQPQIAESIRSTEFCFPESIEMHNGGGDNKWLLARRGQVATTLKLCLKKNGIPKTRKCLGNFTEGAHWEIIKPKETICANQEHLSNVTATLYDLNRSKISINSAAKTVQDIKNLLMYNKKKLIPADLFYMARILKSSIEKISSSATVETTLADLVKQIGSNRQVETLNEATYDIVQIYNYLMEVNEETLRSATVVLNSTNILLDAFETLIDKGSYVDHEKANDMSDSDFDFIVYTDIGVSLKSTANLLVYTIDPSVANVSGVAIFRDLNGTENVEADTLTGAFQGDYYRFLHAELPIEEVIDMPNLQMATYFPRSLLNRLDEISAAVNGTQNMNVSIVIKIYSNDKLFQENGKFVNNKVMGRIVSISVPGHGSDLTELLPLVLRIKRNYDYGNANETRNQFNQTDGNCVYWNYRSWASDGLMFLRHSEVDPNVILCGCTHLTPFAYLIGGNMDLSVKTEDDVIVKQIHTKALDIITMVGCSLSILGIIGTFITAATFQSWRQKASSKVLLQLSTAIALQMILLCFVNTKEHSMHLIENNIISSCIIIGALLHYSVLVQFCWMVVIAHLQFKRYVQVFGNARPKRFLIKSTLFAWGLPLAPSIIVALIDKDSFSEDDICYPSGYALYFGVVFPITIIILVNLITFIIVIYNILRGPDGRIRHTEKRMVISQIRLSVLLFFLLGFTWIFGLMSAIKVGIVFSYLFCLTATLQGFVIFVYFIILDPITRRMWCGYFRRCFGVETSLYESSSSTAKDTTATAM